MKIFLAKEMGMCPGVRRALSIVNLISHPEKTAIYGELVHNEEILRKISLMGFSIIPAGRLDLLDPFDNIVITAHGISDYERAFIIDEKIRIKDTTCPLVKQLHDKVMEYKKAGYFIVLIGIKNHVEVTGITKDLTSFCVVQKPEDIIKYGKENIAVFSQTTIVYEKALLIYEKIKSMNIKSSVIFIDTVCQSARNRQNSIRLLIDKIDILIVIGGKNSNNTLQLCKIAEESGIDYKHIQCPDEINPRWFFSKSAVGISAGASTSDEMIIRVNKRINKINEYFEFLNKTVKVQLAGDLLARKK